MKFGKPPGMLTQEQWRQKNSVTDKEADAGYVFFLYGREKGVMGFRPTNPYRKSRRQWIEESVSIEDKQTGDMVPFRLNEAQRQLEASILRSERRGEPVRVSILKARQQGISTYVTAFFLWLMLTNDGFRVLLMGHKKQSANVLRGRLEKMLGTLRRNARDRWDIKPKKSQGNEFILGSPQGSTAIIESAEAADYRGDTCRGFHCIEPAERPNAEEKANAAMKIVPKAPGTYVIIEGTAHGDSNWYAKTWKHAWRVQSYEESALSLPLRALFFPWYIHDNYRWTVVNRRNLPGKLKQEIERTLDDEERRLLKQSYIRRGVGKVFVDYDQLAWRRYTIQEDCQGMVEFFHQEYPAYPEEAFLSTGMRFFSAKAIYEQKEKHALKPIWRGDLIDPDGERQLARTLEDMESIERMTTDVAR